MKLASIESIKDVKPHPNADRLDLVTVLGYQLVTQRGLYRPDDTVVYIQPDTVLPQVPWAEEFRKYSPKRVKAVKLRGEFSEGILVSKELLETYKPEGYEKIILLLSLEQAGEEVSEILGVTKYEPPVPQDLSAKGGLPFGIPKTDEERWENLNEEEIPFGELVDVTLKVDGQSWSAFYNVELEQFGVTGRSMEYKLDCKNRYTDHLPRYDVFTKLQEFCEENEESLCIRGESYGDGIQKFDHNPHAKLSAGLALFSVWVMSERRHARKGHKFYVFNIAEQLGLPTVPVIEKDVVLTKELIEKYSTGIEKIDGKPFEGVVVNHSKGSFKVINLYYDAKK